MARYVTYIVHSRTDRDTTITSIIKIFSVVQLLTSHVFERVHDRHREAELEKKLDKSRTFSVRDDVVRE